MLALGYTRLVTSVVTPHSLARLPRPRAAPGPRLISHSLFCRRILVSLLYFLIECCSVAQRA